MVKEGRKFLFICDRQKNCRFSSDCGTNCTHTTDIDHAKNDIPDSLREMEKRFVRDAKHPDTWWEVE
mgnify:CR=1 FL=1